MSEWLNLAVQAARDAGTAILSVYRQKLDIETKGAGSPLTIADQSAHRAIMARLAASEIAVVSEEGDTGGFGLGAWKEKAGVRFRCSAVEKSLHCRMVASRFHDHPNMDLFAAANRIYVRMAVGSALKYGQPASAEVDVFPRLVGSSEWDTAAGQAVLESAGGQVLDWHTGKPLRYGKPMRRNPRLRHCAHRTLSLILN